jgi:hypothetical protein
MVLFLFLKSCLEADDGVADETLETIEEVLLFLAFEPTDNAGRLYL